MTKYEWHAWVTLDSNELLCATGHNYQNISKNVPDYVFVCSCCKAAAVWHSWVGIFICFYWNCYKSQTFLKYSCDQEACWLRVELDDPSCKPYTNTIKLEKRVTGARCVREKQDVRKMGSVDSAFSFSGGVDESVCESSLDQLYSAGFSLNSFIKGKIVAQREVWISLPWRSAALFTGDIIDFSLSTDSRWISTPAGVIAVVLRTNTRSVRWWRRWKIRCDAQVGFRLKRANICEAASAIHLRCCIAALFGDMPVEVDLVLIAVLSQVAKGQSTTQAPPGPHPSLMALSKQNPPDGICSCDVAKVWLHYYSPALWYCWSDLLQRQQP